MANYSFFTELIQLIRFVKRKEPLTKTINSKHKTKPNNYLKQIRNEEQTRIFRKKPKPEKRKR